MGYLALCKNIKNARIMHLTMIGRAVITAGAVCDKRPISHQDLSIIGVNVLQYNLIDWCGFIDHASYALSHRSSLEVYPNKSKSSLMSYFFYKSYSPAFRLIDRCIFIGQASFALSTKSSLRYAYYIEGGPGHFPFQKRQAFLFKLYLI